MYLATWSDIPTNGGVRACGSHLTLVFYLGSDKRESCDCSLVYELSLRNIATVSRPTSMRSTVDYIAAQIAFTRVGRIHRGWKR